jgi:hypothetical protein
VIEERKSSSEQDAIDFRARKDLIAYVPLVYSESDGVNPTFILKSVKRWNGFIQQCLDDVPMA